MSHPTELKSEWQALLPRVTELARSASALKTVIRHLSDESGYEALLRLQRDLDKLEALDLADHGLLAEARAAAEPVAAWLSEEWSRRAVEVAEEIRAWFGAREVEVTGEAPVLRAGPLELRLQASRDRIDLYHAGEQVNTKAIPMTPARVFRAWRTALDRLERRSTLPMALSTQLAEAYEQTCKLKNISPGGRARLPDVHFQLFVERQTSKVKQDPRAGRIKEYPRFQFAWDLSRLLDHDEVVLADGRRLVFHDASESAARSKSSSVVVEPRGGRRILSDVQAV